MWVPSEWIVEAKGSCIGDPSAAGMVIIGKLTQASCDPSGQYPIPRQTVALVPSSRSYTDPPSLTVHGYRVYDGNRHGKTLRIVYDIPQLHVIIATRGTFGNRILESLAPSASKVALDPAYQAVPSNWHAVTEDGVSLSIPPAWLVATPPNLGCGGWLSSDPSRRPELLLIKPRLGVLNCPFILATAAEAAHDGVYLYLPPNNHFGPSPTGRPITTLQHGATTIAVYPDDSDPNALDLVVRKDGSSRTHVLKLGLGRDGRIAAGVLASIEATT